MANVLQRHRQQGVLNLLSEGNSIRSTERLTGIHRDTICRLVVRYGERCKDCLDGRLRNLRLRHLEVDEIWTFVAKKQARLTVDERAERSDIGDMFLWTAVDQDTKLVASFAVGKRSADNARRFLVDLAARLALPNPHASDAHAFQAGGYPTVCQLSTDGFAAYPEAVDLAFGPYVKYGTIVKDFRNATMQYTPSEMVGAKRTAKRGLPKREAWTICTSHVERHNLTIRTFMKRFNRLSLGFSKRLENLAGAIAMYLAYYNYCWRPRLPGTSGRRRVTPAMAAKLTDHIWTFAELFETVA
jgi:IS1 family transposase